MQNFLYAQIGLVTDYRGLKYNWRTKLVIETVSLNQPLSAGVHICQEGKRTDLS